jgi:lysozyme
MNYLNMIDISHWEGTVDWGKFAESDHRQSAVIVKATESNDFLDSEFKSSKMGLEDWGFVWGAYHFFWSSVDPHRQSDWYLKTVGDWKPGMLPPVLDLEKKDASPNKTQSRVGEWIKDVMKATGCTPIIYTSPSFWNEKCNGGLDWIIDLGCKLWIANYDVFTPNVPGKWKEKGWWGWQYATNGRFAGIPGACDVNYLNCTEQELRQLARLEDAPPVEPNDKEKIKLLWDAHPELHKL